MTTNRSYHAMTSAQREFGGLRRLDFMIDRLEVSSLGQRKKDIEVLLMGWGNGSLGLPIVSIGYALTILEPDAKRAANAREVTIEHGLAADIIHAGMDGLGARTFNVIILDGEFVSMQTLAVVSAYLRLGGYVLVASGGSFVGPWSRLARHLHEFGWRARKGAVATSFVRDISVLLQRWGMRPMSAWFRRLDVCDRWISEHWPLALSHRWLFELEPVKTGHSLVLQLMPGLGVGGTERIVFELADRLPARNVDVKVLALMEGGAMEPLFREHDIPLTLFQRQGLLRWRMFRDLSHILFFQRPDIVHTHLFGADAWGRLAAFIHRVPVVISTEHNVNPGYGFIKRSINRWFAKKTDAFIAITKEVRRVMILKDGIPEKKIHHIPNGIDLGKVIPRGARLFHDIPRLITVGRLEAQKGHAILLQALARIDRPWRLQIIGNGSLAAELRILAERLHLSSRIEWLGVREDVPSLLANADVFCFPSQWEGVGLAALEAAAAGVPMLLSDLPPLRETFDVDETTFVPAQDVEAWTAAIDAVLADPLEAVMRAARAVPRIQSEVSVDAMVAAYAKLYDLFLKQKHRI